MRSFARLMMAVILISIPIALAFVAHEGLTRYERVVMPWSAGDEERFVEIPSGTRAVDALRLLEEAGALRDVDLALLVLERSGRARDVRAGEYRFDRPLSIPEVLGRLVKGDVFLRTITFPEGLNRYDMARRWAASGLGTEHEFLAASARAERIADIDPNASDLEGYLFPDTYALARSDDAEAVVERMVASFRAAIGEDGQTRAEASGMTMREVVSLAALVEKETAVAEERPLVAGVYRARLRKGMRLQADPTVIYGLILEGRWDGDLKRSHLREPAPYNTYARSGLPPGPIANPGRAALDAAFDPETTDYLYFVSRNDGTHAFSRTLREHNRKVNEFQRTYWRDKWRKAGGRKKYLEQQAAAADDG